MQNMVFFFSFQNMDKNPDPVNYLAKLFYQHGADLSFKFKNGETVKCNRYLLAARHINFYKFLFEDDFEPSEIQITDCEAESFRLFLDCIMGITECSQVNISRILPIVFKYQIEECIEKWLKFFKPSKLELNEDLCKLLNAAVLYKCNVLVNSIVEFLRKDCTIYKLLDKEGLCFLLEPEPMRILLNHVQMDSYMYKILFKWGKQYLKKNNLQLITLKSFFTEQKMSKMISLENFENVQSILTFNEFKPTKGYFTHKEILDYISKAVYSKKKSQWVKIKKGESFEEVFPTGNWYLAKNRFLQFDIHRNNVVFYDWPKEENFSCIDYVVSWKLLDVKNNKSTVVRFKIFHENDLIKSLKSAYLVLLIKELGEEFILNEIKINYTFNVDCRILKATADFQVHSFFTESNNDTLFFTNSISTCLASIVDNK